MIGSTIERARGRWKEILPRIGIDASYLTNKHGPCPICGGKDRFRFDDLRGEGTYFCNQCGAGVGIILVRKKHGWDHASACREIDAIIGTDTAVTVPVRERPGSSTREAIERVLDGARSQRVVDDYLLARGLGVGSPVLRGHPGLFHKESGRTYPAVVAPIMGPDGRLQSVQRIFVGATTDNKKAMTPVATITGAAVRLFEPGIELGVAEGCETAMACFELFGIPTWAALTANGLEAFRLPPELRPQCIHVFGDNDANYTGQAAAYRLANYLMVHAHLNVEVHIPPVVDTDWLDVLNDRGAAA